MFYSYINIAQYTVQISIVLYTYIHYTMTTHNYNNTIITNLKLIKKNQCLFIYCY